MAFQTESSHVGEVAFAAAGGDRDDVVGIPKRFATFQTPSGNGFQASRAAETPDMCVFDNAIYSAEGADTFISFEDAFA